jgi:hypothetical protein
LSLEIDERRICGRFGNFGSPLPEELAHPRLVTRIADRWRIGDPQIGLEPAIAPAAECVGPRCYPAWVCQQRADRAHAAGVGDRDPQACRAGPGHRRHQDRDAQPIALAKLGGADAGGGGNVWHGWLD